jgi:hypothetical protein
MIVFIYSIDSWRQNLNNGGGGLGGRALPRSARPRGAPVGYDLELDAIVEYAFLLLYSHLLINVVVKYMKFNNNNNNAAL